MPIPPRAHEAYLVRQRDRSVWEPDAAIRVNRGVSYNVTNHPVETGVTVSDLVQLDPETIDIEVVISENPSSGNGGPLRLRRSYQWLRDTADAGDLVNVVTRRMGTIRDCLITGLPHSLDNVARLRFTISLQQVVIARATFVEILVENVAESSEAGAPDEADVGEQSTTDTAEDEEAEAKDQSVLSSLLGGL